MTYRRSANLQLGLFVCWVFLVSVSLVSSDNWRSHVSWTCIGPPRARLATHVDLKSAKICVSWTLQLHLSKRLTLSLSLASAKILFNRVKEGAMRTNLFWWRKGSLGPCPVTVTHYSASVSSSSTWYGITLPVSLAFLQSFSEQLFHFFQPF